MILVSVIFKLQKIKHEEKFFERDQRKKTLTYIGARIRIPPDFFAEIIQVRIE